MNAQTVRREHRPHLELVSASTSALIQTSEPSEAPRDGTPEPIELRALPRVATPRPALSMAGVTSGLQLLLAARRAARIAAMTD